MILTWKSLIFNWKTNWKTITNSAPPPTGGTRGNPFPWCRGGGGGPLTPATYIQYGVGGGIGREKRIGAICMHGKCELGHSKVLISGVHVLLSRKPTPEFWTSCPWPYLFEWWSQSHINVHTWDFILSCIQWGYLLPTDMCVLERKIRATCWLPLQPPRRQ